MVRRPMRLPILGTLMGKYRAREEIIASDIRIKTGSEAGVVVGRDPRVQSVSANGG
jgi:hypothetical protein